MITHCPECGNKLIHYPCFNGSKIEPYFFLDCNNIKFHFQKPEIHYALYFFNETLLTKSRISLINNKLCKFYTGRSKVAYTTVSIINLDYDEIIFKSNEFFGEVDELAFMNKILKMKAFL